MWETFLVKGLKKNRICVKDPLPNENYLPDYFHCTISKNSRSYIITVVSYLTLLLEHIIKTKKLEHV